MAHWPIITPSPSSSHHRRHHHPCLRLLLLLLLCVAGALLFPPSPSVLPYHSSRRYAHWTLGADFGWDCAITGNGAPYRRPTPPIPHAWRCAYFGQCGMRARARARVCLCEQKPNFEQSKPTTLLGHWHQDPGICSRPLHFIWTAVRTRSIRDSSGRTRFALSRAHVSSPSSCGFGYCSPRLLGALPSQPWKLCWRR